MAATRELAPLLGASVLSGVGSLPSHLAPLIVVALVSDSILSVATAGWIPSALLVGQLSAFLALPLFAVAGIRTAHAIAASALMVGALLHSGSARLPTLLVTWFLVGGCCGTLQYLGITAAARYRSPSLAFSMRLGTVLLLAGAVAGVLQAIGVVASYHSLVPCLCLAISFLLTAGVVLYRPAPRVVHSIRGVAKGDSAPLLVSGLITVFLLFVGQTGFLAYVVAEAADRGISLAHAVWAIAAMKIAAGACLFGAARIELHDSRNREFLALGILLATSTVMASFTASAGVLFVALFGFELAFNLLSARVQAAMALIAPMFAGQWLGVAILLGAAVGPALHGAMIAIGIGSTFTGFSILTALVPWFWIRSTGTPMSARGLLSPNS